jgi:putative transposase
LEAFAQSAKEHDIVLELIQRGKPTQNTYIKHFNRTYQDEELNICL